MTNQPFFSIVTASYNSEKTIKDTILSILNQQFSDFEFLIIDGASTDSTITIIRSFEQAFKEKGIRYFFISEKDKGIYDAWNKGIALSKGKWISFLGSDDMYFPDALKNYYSSIEKNSFCNFISSKVELINDKKEVLQVIGKPFMWKKTIRNMDIAQVGSFHKTELIDAVGLFDIRYRIVGDLDFYIRSKTHIKPFYFDKVTAKMLNNGVSNQIYPALKEALEAKLRLKSTSMIISYYDFYLSLLKCYLKILIKKK